MELGSSFEYSLLGLQFNHWSYKSGTSNILWFLLGVSKWSGKHSIGREFQSLAVQGKNCWHEHSCNIWDWWQKNHAIYQNSKRPSSRIRKWNHLRQVQIKIYQQWARGSREGASERPTMLCICFCSLSNNSK